MGRDPCDIYIYLDSTSDDLQLAKIYADEPSVIKSNLIRTAVLNLFYILQIEQSDSTEKYLTRLYNIYSVSHKLPYIGKINVFIHFYLHNMHYMTAIC